ncbi:uncharacterized protein LOC120486576 isoform X2 [Pimephales promelas]|uniref:uncharacterized protein LOC120486576 isoform X2 n=1 Tax=Pimephales promelas TaxID=90988 RepID=UPI001955C65F|nr:uncharacterized protein LOC120486576 isoform X2 [Pimephales promelas]
MFKGKTSVFFWLCFCRLYGVFAGTDELKSVSVMEGDSVSLNSGLTEIQNGKDITWKFGPNKNLIARTDGVNNTIYDVLDGIFRDRLKLDNKTGSLTIMNIRNNHTGVYEVKISSSGPSSTHRFNVTVYAPLPVPVISNSSPCSSSSSTSSSSNCSLVCSSVLSVCDATLSWYRGMSVLSNISVCDLSISLSLPLEVEYQDNNTYSCVLNNPISNQTTHLDINTLCSHTCAAEVTQSPSQSSSRSYSQSPSQSSPSPSTSDVGPQNVDSQNEGPPNHMLIFAGAAAVAGSLLTVTLVGIIWICKKRGKTDQEETVRTSEERKGRRKKETVRTSEDEITYADPIFYKRNVQKAEDEVVYASVVPRR